MAGQNSASPNIDDLTPEEASRIIHSHRKVRYGMLLIYFVFLFVSSPILPLYLLHLWSFIVFLFLSLVCLYPLRASILLFFFFSEASSFPWSSLSSCWYTGVSYLLCCMDLLPVLFRSRLLHPSLRAGVFGPDRPLSQSISANP